MEKTVIRVPRESNLILVSLRKKTGQRGGGRGRGEDALAPAPSHTPTKTPTKVDNLYVPTVRLEGTREEVKKIGERGRGGGSGERRGGDAKKLTI